MVLAISIMVPTSLRLSVILYRRIIFRHLWSMIRAFFPICLPVLCSILARRRNKPNKRNETIEPWSIYRHAVSNFSIPSPLFINEFRTSNNNKRNMVNLVHFGIKKNGFPCRLFGLFGRRRRRFYNHQKDSLPFLFPCIDYYCSRAK